jgi:hypothetical protein
VLVAPPIVAIEPYAPEVIEEPVVPVAPPVVGYAPPVPVAPEAEFRLLNLMAITAMMEAGGRMSTVSRFGLYAETGVGCFAGTSRNKY